MFPFTGRPGRNLKAFCAAAFCNDTGGEMSSPYLAYFAKIFLGATPVQYGLIETISEATNRLLRVATGALSDRIGRKPPVVIGYALILLSRGGLALATAWHHLVPWRMLRQVGRAIRNPAREASLAESFPPEQRGKAFGALEMVDTLGAVLGPLVGLWCLAKLGGPGSEPAYRRLFLLSMIPTAISILIISWWMKETRPASAPDRRAGPGGEGLLARLAVYWANPRLRLISLASMLLAVGAVSIDMVQFVLYSLVGGSVALGGAAFVIFTACHALTSYPAGIAVDRWGRRPALLAADGLGTAALAALAFAPSAWWALPAFAAYGAFESFWVASRRAAVADAAAESGAAGQTMGTFSTLYGIGALISPFFFGVVWQVAGLRAACLVCAGLCALSGAALHFGLRRDRGR